MAPTLSSLPLEIKQELIRVASEIDQESVRKFSKVSSQQIQQDDEEGWEDEDENDSLPEQLQVDLSMSDFNITAGNPNMTLEVRMERVERKIKAAAKAMESDSSENEALRDQLIVPKISQLNKEWYELASAEIYKAIDLEDWDNHHILEFLNRVLPVARPSSFIYTVPISFHLRKIWFRIAFFANYQFSSENMEPNPDDPSDTLEKVYYTLWGEAERSRMITEIIKYCDKLEEIDMDYFGAQTGKSGLWGGIISILESRRKVLPPDSTKTIDSADFQRLPRRTLLKSICLTGPDDEDEIPMFPFRQMAWKIFNKTQGWGWNSKFAMNEFIPLDLSEDEMEDAEDNYLGEFSEDVERLKEGEVLRVLKRVIGEGEEARELVDCRLSGVEYDVVDSTPIEDLQSLSEFQKLSKISPLSAYLFLQLPSVKSLVLAAFMPLSDTFLLSSTFQSVWSRSLNPLKEDILSKDVLLSSLPANIRSLELNGCWRLGIKGLDLLLHGLRNLRILKLIDSPLPASLLHPTTHKNHGGEGNDYELEKLYLLEWDNQCDWRWLRRFVKSVAVEELIVGEIGETQIPDLEHLLFNPPSSTTSVPSSSTSNPASTATDPSATAQSTTTSTSSSSSPPLATVLFPNLKCLALKDTHNLSPSEIEQLNQLCFSRKIEFIEPEDEDEEFTDSDSDIILGGDDIDDEDSDEDYSGDDDDDDDPDYVNRPTANGVMTNGWHDQENGDSDWEDVED